MQKRKILIAEGSEELRTALADMLAGSCHIRTCTDGEAARQALMDFQPDVLVLDLMLPGMDGISLLHWAREQNVFPMVLATTRFCNDYVTETVQSLGVAYLMIKPCRLTALAERIGDLNRRLRPVEAPVTDPAARIGAQLLSLGIPTKLRGCTYLREAVVIYAADPLQSVTKSLYPRVAKQCGCESSHVERCIRSAIDAGWRQGNREIWRLYFPAGADGKIPRPTNGAFIARLADSLRTGDGEWTSKAEFAQNPQKKPRDASE